MCLGFFKKLFYVSKVSKANVKKKIPLAFQKEISKEEKVQISNTVLLNKSLEDKDLRESQRILKGKAWRLSRSLSLCVKTGYISKSKQNETNKVPFYFLKKNGYHQRARIPFF